MYALRFEGTRYDIGNKLDFIKTNLIFGLQQPDIAKDLRAFVRSQPWKSGNDSVTACCIASNVSRSTWLANNEASTGVDQPRRPLTVTASPFTPLSAAALTVATVGQAAISAS